jgi:hypothetical protein
MRRLLAAGAAVAVAGVVLAWWVLESSGVAVVETRKPDGGTRETHVWYVRAEGGVWLEAGRPVHPWYRDLRRDPRLVIRADDLEGTFVAEIVPGKAAHDRVRALLREKYGLRDRILGWVVDTSPSIAIRLEAVSDPAGPGPASASPATGSRGTD